ncbi:hypothetical protein [Arsenicibacter rosenii]|uniref:Uncharacterized protein n=1 Tax=Arsenicibacter rosenii TaxID=1750698 RepID=A0A1S2VEV1_9BACT|nr:hypothetical protein [Arsenicibacter rosenii]OIN56815.1 hypothetical protein BLX24_22840 [Arsenicibacter rosenii]
MDYNFSEKVDLLIRESGKTKKSLYDFLEMTAQGFDNMMKQNSFSAIRLAKIAEFFEIQVGFFYDQPSNTYKRKSGDGGAFGEQVLDELRKVFKEELNQKNQQLLAKDRQLENKDRQLENKDKLLEGMQRTIDALVGKSSDVTADDRHDDPKIIVHPAFARKSEEEVNDYQIA